MTPLTVVPGQLTPRLAELTRAAGWKLNASATTRADLSAALSASAEGHLVLFVPNAARVPARLAQILVPHDGTPATSLSLDAVSDLLASSHAEVIVLHVAGAELPIEAGSLPAPRMVDHVERDWGGWREEFGRRFFSHSRAAFVRLDVGVGSTTPTILKTARQLPSDLLVLAWSGVLKVGSARTLRPLCSRAPCPVLLVRQEPGPPPDQG